MGFCSRDFWSNNFSFESTGSRVAKRLRFKSWQADHPSTIEKILYSARANWTYCEALWLTKAAKIWYCWRRQRRIRRWHSAGHSCRGPAWYIIPTANKRARGSVSKSRRRIGDNCDVRRSMQNESLSLKFFYLNMGCFVS